jgi:hypothetical protein
LEKDNMAERPPKPKDRAASPRFKKKSGKGKTMGIDAVAALSNAEFTGEDFQLTSIVIKSDKDDRGAAILLAADVENALWSAIVRRLGIPRDRRKELLGQNSPLGTFYNKIILGHAIGLFGEETRFNLDLIKAIRNSFAHARLSITFATKPVADACALLKQPDEISHSGFRTRFNDKDFKLLPTSQQFQKVCEVTTRNLMRITLPRHSSLRVPLDVGVSTLARRPALP